jgi:hypothetical protein
MKEVWFPGVHISMNELDCRAFASPWVELMPLQSMVLLAAEIASLLVVTVTPLIRVWASRFTEFRNQAQRGTMARNPNLTTDFPAVRMKVLFIWLG